jgi:hypothetical protein
MFSNREHYFLAQTRGGKLEISYANRAELMAAAFVSPVLYADEKTKEDLAGALSESGAGQIHPERNVELRVLPEVKNIAAAQGRLAFDGLSKVGSICEKLIEVDENLTCRREIRLELARLYPYNIVTPTYLRAPSVTLKKTNV